MRIVVEHENPLVARSIADDLEAAGHTAIVCHGPSLRAGRSCPVVEDGPCRLVADADVVLAGLPRGRLNVYIGLRSLSDVPVVLTLSAADRASLPILERVGPWVPRSLRGPALAAALEGAVHRLGT